MEGGSSHDAVPPSAGFDKSRVLDVKPLRSLMPVFPATSQAPSFQCMPPFAQNPNGYSPFYPFAPQGSQTSPHLNTGNPSPMRTPTMPAPIRSYRAPGADFPEECNGVGDDGYFDTHVGSSSSRKKTTKENLSRKKIKKNQDIDSLTNNNFVTVLSPSQIEDGNRELVNYVLQNFDALRRRICQLEDSKDSKTGLIKRADLKAGNIVMTKKIRTNMRRRIGILPGVEIGDIFFFRMEMCAVGVHAPSMAGIDYMTGKGDAEKDPMALSIVSSGGYDDDAEDSDVLIYSGQGGNAKDKEASDQKLERGNLALERSLHHGNEVRVIRGVRDDASATTKIYVYDGLYKVQESWTERGKTGCSIFKYKLIRVAGQPGAFSIWQAIRKWKDGFSSRAGLVLQDLTSGAEPIPIPLVNEVDSEKALSSFTYFPTLKYSKSFTMMPPSFGCNCRSACAPGDTNCACIQKNGGDFPYTSNGLLVSRKELLHECGPTCPCTPNCKNRVSQSGVKLRLEVFKTKDRGWGLRSWDAIRAGSFICEYAGEVIDEVKLKQKGDEVENNEYVFDSGRAFESFKWNCEPGLLDEESSNNGNEDYNLPYRLIIGAKNVGNVARFINHSCSPNLFWQPVIYEHNNQSFLHIAFFAMRHIPPLTELTYDYGISGSNEAASNNGRHRKNNCLCGSSKCRGYFG